MSCSPSPAVPVQGWPGAMAAAAPVGSRVEAGRPVLYALLALALTLGLIFNLLTPAFLGPDEPAHFEYVQSLVQSEGARTTEPEGARLTAVEYYQPPTYYWLALPGYLLTRGEPVPVQAVATRLVSVLLFVGEVALAYLLARTLAPGNPFVYLATPALVALLPGRAWIAGLVNNDNLASLASAGLLYFLVRWILRGFDGRSLAGLVTMIALALVSKATTLPLVAVAVLAVAAVGFRRGWKVRPGPGLALVGVLWVALFLAGMGWVVVGRLGNTLGSVLEGLAAIPEPDLRPLALQFKSFWLPVWGDDYAPPRLAYQIAMGLCAAASLGLAPALLRAGLRWRSLNRRRLVCTALLALVAAAVWVVPLVRYLAIVGGTDSFLAPRHLMWAIHGRFLYPALVPGAYLAAAGLGQLLPAQIRGLALAVVVALLLYLDGVALFSLVSQLYWWSS